MDEFEVDDEGFAFTRRLTPIDLAVVGLGLVADLAGSVTKAVNLTQILVMNHANWQAERRLFMQEAGYEIESLTSGDEEDG